MCGYIHEFIGKKRHVAQAALHFRESLSLWPQDPNVMLHLAQVLHKEGANKEAEEWYRRCIACCRHREGFTAQGGGFGARRGPDGLDENELAQLGLPCTCLGTCRWFILAVCARRHATCQRSRLRILTPASSAQTSHR